MKFALAIGVSLAALLSLIRIMSGTSFLYYILIGQILSLILMFFTPKVFTAIAFDAGGATGGSLTTAFLLPIAMGTCIYYDVDILTGAFGLAAFVSLTPILTVEIVGIIYKLKNRVKTKVIDNLDDSIIDFTKEEY